MKKLLVDQVPLFSNHKNNVCYIGGMKYDYQIIKLVASNSIYMSVICDCQNYQDNPDLKISSDIPYILLPPLVMEQYKIYKGDMVEYEEVSSLDHNGNSYIKSLDLHMNNDADENLLVSLFKNSLCGTCVNIYQKFVISYCDSLGTLNNYHCQINGMKNSLKNIQSGILSVSTEINIINRKPLLDISNLSYEAMNIGGVKKQYDEILYQVITPRLYSRNYYPKGFILYGSPGTGKTRFARSLAKLIKCDTIKMIDGPEILSKWHGESEGKIRDLFKDAEIKKNKLHMIIFDEMDSIFGRRYDSESSLVRNSIVNQLLAKIDGLQQYNNIIIVGITNRFDMLDPAITRSGRLDVHIHFDYPDHDGRKEILNICAKDIIGNILVLLDEQEYDILADKTSGMSGADIEKILNMSVDNEAGKLKFSDVFKTLEGFEKNKRFSKICQFYGGDNDYDKEIEMILSVDKSKHRIYLLNKAKSYEQNMRYVCAMSKFFDKIIYYDRENYNSISIMPIINFIDQQINQNLHRKDLLIIFNDIKIIGVGYEYIREYIENRLFYGSNMTIILCN